MVNAMGPKWMKLSLHRWILQMRRRGNPLHVSAYLVTGILLMWLLRVLWRPPMDWEVNVFREELDEQAEPIAKHDKWIVVTTVNTPTRSMKALAAIPGWKMVVVGDKKTPDYWDLPGVVYLDIQAQEKMHYTVLSLLPYNSYSRKIIGYLYAIRHGAIFIYDTDDDNYPSSGLQGFRLTAPIHSLFLDTANVTANPFVHFGQSSLWPRGYPLDHLGRPTSHQYKLCETKPPAVQQALADQDPDVDSTVRLTRKMADVHMNLYFDAKAPPLIIPQGTYVPFNSQSTLFRYKAFWSLVFPISVTFRTADIYRGYWAQKLLWMIGDRVGYHGPLVEHERNAHSYIDDALQEYDFLKMGKLVEVLQRWDCTRLHFFSCATALAWEMVSAGFWERDDVDLIDAWLTDLASIGYVSPMLRDTPHVACTHGQTPHQVHFHPVEQTTTMLHSSQNFYLPTSSNGQVISHFIANTCNIQSSAPVHQAKHTFPDTLLVVQIEGQGNIIPVLEAWYRPHFPHIIYCGKHDQVSTDLIHKLKISYLGLKESVAHVSCVAQAMWMGYNVSGYLFVPEMALLQLEPLRRHSVQQLWLTQDWEVSEPATIQACQEGTIHCQPFSKDKLAQLANKTPKLRIGNKYQLKVKACFSKLASNPVLHENTLYLRDLVFYLPSRLTQLFLQVAAVYSSSQAAAEFDIVSVLLLECLELAPEYLPYTTLGESQAEGVDYIFPYQAQEVIEKGAVHAHFCANVLSNS